MTERNYSFIEILIKDTSDYKGEFSSFIREAEPLYSLCVNLVKSEELKGDARLFVLSAIAYFMVSDDLFPEDKYGPLGYIEDLMVVCRVLELVAERNGMDLILNNWEKEPDLLTTILTEYFPEAKTAFSNLYEKVCEYCGIDQ
jgi:uncharacterized membrane protein YkvA (DUF1232 family)